MNHHHGVRKHRARRCNRAQCAKIISIISILLILIIPYIVLTYILDPFNWLYCIIWILLIISYLNASFTSPGVVEKGWYKNYPSMHQTLIDSYNDQIEHHQKLDKKYASYDDNDDETKSLITIDNNIELPEHFARPPRSHYCHELNGQILRMDHFCVWLNNAVGFKNYKYFILTVFYLWLIAFQTFYIIIYDLCIDKKSMSWLDVSIYYIIFCTISIVICLMFFIFATIHLCMHLYLKMPKHLTSIEYMEFKQVERICKYYKIEFCGTHEYDHGIFENIKRMIGSNICFWLIPIWPKLKDDPYKYDINKKNQDKIHALHREIELKRTTKS